LIEVATGFAISPNVIATNGHVVRGLEQVMAFYSDTVKLVAVVNGGNVVTGQGVHELNLYAVHPEYNEEAEIESFDLALVTTKTPLPATVAFASSAAARALAPGDAVATIGFPGELEMLYELYPVASFKDGTISALRSLNGAAPTAANRYFVQHNLNLSGGTSGSPIFNQAGNVVAVNNSGIVTTICIDETDCTTIPGALGFGIRADGFGPVLSESRLRFSDIEYVGSSNFSSPGPVVERLIARRASQNL
jgi:S1-C subfamily serine protease